MLSKALSRVAQLPRLCLISQSDNKLKQRLLGTRRALSIGTQISSKGPDRVLPANSFTSTRPEVPVKLRGGNHPSAEWAPKSVWKMLQETVARAPDQIALTVKREGRWVSWSYVEYEADIRRVAKAFIKLGLRPHHSVAIIGHNAPEWHQANIAAVVAGGIATGVYPTNSPEAVDYVL